MTRTVVWLLLAATGALCSAAHGQDGLPESVSLEHPTAEGFAPDREATAALTIEPSDPTGEHQNEIVVTAPIDESDMRVPSTADDRAAAAAAAARTPCAGCVVVSGAGVRIGFGRPPPMPLLIDLKAIPEAPPGSAAARYADE